MRLSLLPVTIALASCAGISKKSACSGSLLQALGHASPLTIRVEDRVLHPIDPRLFGQFMERPAFNGEIGAEAAVVPGTHDLQPEASRLIRGMRIPIIRFPGGTDVDFLDWTEMIDNLPGRTTAVRPISRPHRKLCVPVSNGFGYDEFLRMCERNGSEADITVNFRDGLLGVRPLEEAAARAAALVAYCNAPVDGHLSPALAQWPRLRATNGHPEPYRVRYIQIGNETWIFDSEVRKKYPKDPEGHWLECLEAYIKAILAVDPSVKIIADAFPEPVSAKIHAEFGKSIEGYASHHYLPWGIHQVEKDGRKKDLGKLTAEEIWKAWVAIPSMDSNGQALLVDEHLAQARKLGYKIAITEWNWNGWWAVGKGEKGKKSAAPALDSLYAKGLGAASFLHSFMRQGDVLSIGMQSMLVGSHWPINSIRVDRHGKVPAFMMPTGIVTQLYSQHHGDRLMEVELSGQEYFSQPFTMADIKPSAHVATVDVVATRDTRANTLTIHMINRRFTGKRPVVIDCAAFGLKPQEVEIFVMEGRLNDTPRPGEPLSPAGISRKKVPLTGNRLMLDLPPRSIVFAQFAL